MSRLSISAAMCLAVSALSIQASVYDASWTNDYTWTVLKDQTVTSAPTVPTIYTGETTFNSKVGGSGNAKVLIFSGGSVDMPEDVGLISDNGAFRLAVMDDAAVTLTDRKGWYSSGCHFELVSGTVSGEGGISFGGKYNKDTTIDIYGGTWTAPVKPNNWDAGDLSTPAQVRVYGGVFAPTSLLPVNTGYRGLRTAVLMAGGTFVCPSMKMSNNKQSVETGFFSETCTESVLKLGAESVTWANRVTLAAGSLVRLVQNEEGRSECLNVTSNFTGSGEIRLEGPSLSLADAICGEFAGTISLKSGKLDLGASRNFGAGAKIVFDFPVGTHSGTKAVWESGMPPTGVEFALSDALSEAGYVLRIGETGARACSGSGLVIMFQ